MDKRLAKILSEVFRLRESEIQPSLQKEDVGSWDSLRQMDLVISLENEFSVVLTLPEIASMNSVADIVSVLKKKGVSLAD